jgi:hypothetical protein
MDQAQQLEQLQQLFLNAPGSTNTRVVAIVASLLLATTVLWLVRRRRLGGEFTAVWIGVACVAAALGISEDLLHGLTRLVGAWTPRSTLFFFGQFFLVFTCLHYAVRLSSLSVQVKNLAQEIALLRAGAGAEPAPGPPRSWD